MKPLREALRSALPGPASAGYYQRLLELRKVTLAEPPVCDRRGCSRYRQGLTPTAGAGFWICLGHSLTGGSWQNGRRVGAVRVECSVLIRIYGSHPGFKWGPPGGF